MKAKGGNWTFDELNKFLTNPRGYIPGTAMTFAGLSREQQRADVIDFLRHLVGQSDAAAEGGGQCAGAGQAPAPAAKPAEAPRQAQPRRRRPRNNRIAQRIGEAAGLEPGRFVMSVCQGRWWRTGKPT